MPTLSILQLRCFLDMLFGSFCLVCKSNIHQASLAEPTLLCSLLRIATQLQQRFKKERSSDP
jgi:hypothetical protein